MGVKDEFFKRGSFIKGDGTRNHFWEDVWLGSYSLASQYPDSYSIVRTKNVVVVDVLN
jgi:hypothetical protein